MTAALAGTTAMMSFTGAASEAAELSEAASKKVSAYFSESACTVDGDISDSVMVTNALLGDTDASAGFGWNSTGIAAAVNTGTVGASAVNITLAGKSYTYDLSASAFAGNAGNAQAAKSGSMLELFFPYADLGLTFSPVTRNIPVSLSLTVGTDEIGIGESCLTTVCGTITAFDNCDDFTAANYALKSKYGQYTDVATVSDGGKYSFFYDGTKDAICGYGRSCGLSAGPFFYEMNVKIDDIPAVTPDKLSAWYGLGVDFSFTDCRPRMTITDDGSGNLKFNALYYDATDANGLTRSIPLGVAEGSDAFTLRVEAAADYSLTVYVDGNPVGTLPAIDMPTTYTHTYYEFTVAPCNIKAGTGIYDVEVSSITMGKTIGLWENLTFETIKGVNASPDNIYGALSLPASLSFGSTGITVPLTWSSSDTGIMSDAGVPTFASGTAGSSVTMTAAVTVDGESFTKDFLLTVQFETMEDEMYYLTDDRNPFLGSMNATEIDFDFTFDATENSVGLDLGQAARINTVVLYDSDDTNKMHRSDVAIFVSDDNLTYTKISDFDLFRTSDKFIFTGFDATARYIKAHYYSPDNDAPSFTNRISSIITASFEEELPACGGASFEKLGSFALKSVTDMQDGTAFVAFADMGIDMTKLQSDKRDLRFAIGTRALMYFIENGGAYIRIPESSADTAVTVDVYGSNASAQSLSDADSVFEISYGNRTIHEVNGTDFNHVISTVRCPNGDILAVGSKEIVKTTLTSRRSADGGRTWSEPELFWENGKHADGCAFLVDGDRMWCFFHVFPGGGAWTLKVAILESDDNGYTWFNPDTGVVGSCYIPDTGDGYSVTYCDGVKAASFDGDGNGIDYVFAYTGAETHESSLYLRFMYSRDAGRTWQASESIVTYDAGTGGSVYESGCSECSLAVLPDGTMKAYIRVQYPGVVQLGETTSTDNGLTWTTNAKLIQLYSPNTFPVLKNCKNDILLLWAGNNIMGGTSYYRNPLNLAYSTDGMQTWNKKLDVWSGTWLGTLEACGYKSTQPKLVFDDYMGVDTFHLAWWHYSKGMNYTMTIENGEDYLYKSKGAADDFESTSPVYEGWEVDKGNLTITDERASTGTHSLKIQDADKTATRVSRSIPELYAGEISFDLNLANANTALYVEFKSPLSLEHYKGDRLAFYIDKNGKITGVKANNMTDVALNANAVIPFDEWHRITVKFALDCADAFAKIYLDGTELGNLPINNSVFGGICFVQFSDGSSAQAAGLTAYVDNFRAYEGTSYVLTDVTDAETSITVNLVRADGDTPVTLAESGYANFAKLTVYADESNTNVLREVNLEDAATDTSTLTATVVLPEGTYGVKVTKNGYKPYFGTVVSGESTEITLIPGDVAGSYSDRFGDGKADVNDFIRVVRGLASGASDALKAYTDINEDGTVSVADLALIKANFDKE